MLTREKPIQISDHRLLTNKGRLFEEFIDGKGKRFWVLVELPDFKNDFTEKPIKGKTQFVDFTTDKEKFEKSKTINDLLNE